MSHIFFDILYIIIIIVLLYLVHTKIVKCRKNTENLIDILSKNINFLDNYYKNQEIIQLKKSINLYSKLQILLKVSNCDYISFFKYDYSKKFIMLNFLLSVSDNGTIIDESNIDGLPVSSDDVILKILDFYDKTGLSYLTLDNITDNKFIDNLLIKNDVKKIYFKNIFKDKNIPEGFIIFCYKNHEYILNDDDKTEILRILKPIKYFL